VQADLDGLGKELALVKQRKESHSDAIDQVQNTQREPQLLIDQAARDLANLKDFRQVFCSRISSRDGDVKKAREWIDANRGKLQGECYGPVGMEIQVKEDFAAHVLEKTVGMGRLLTIICDNKADEDVLNRELRGIRKLRVNIVTMYHRDEFRCPYSEQVLEQCSSWGLQGPIGDLYVMPDLVRIFLNNFTAFHTVLWAHTAASRITPSELNGLCASAQQRGFRVFAVDMESRQYRPDGTSAYGRVKEIVDFSGSISRYRPNAPPSIKQENVKPAQLVRGGTEGDSGEQKERLQGIITENRARIAEMDSEIERLRKEGTRFSDQITELAQKIRDRKNLLRAPEHLAKMLQKERERKREMEGRLSVGLEQEKKEATQKLRKAVDMLVASVQQVQRASEESIKAGVAKLHVSHFSRESTGELSSISDALDDANRSLVDLQRRIRQCEEDRDACHRRKSQAEEDLKSFEVEVGGESVRLPQLHSKSIMIIILFSDSEQLVPRGAETDGGHVLGGGGQQGDGDQGTIGSDRGQSPAHQEVHRERHVISA
jgi:hypothetical protein